MKKITSILLSMVMVMTVITIVPVVWGGGVFAEPAVHWVTTNANDGEGSLRAAIAAATNDGDVIKFADSFFTVGGGVATENHVITAPITISPESTLEISKAITIEGRTIGVNDNDFEVGSPAVIIKGQGTDTSIANLADDTKTEYNEEYATALAAIEAERVEVEVDEADRLKNLAVDRKIDLLNLEYMDATAPLGGNNLRLINVATLAHESTLSISNVTFTMAKNSVAGAAIATTAGTTENQYILSLDNCRFEGNEAVDASGAAIALLTAVHLKLNECRFIKNSSTIKSNAGSSGTIAMNNGVVNAKNSVFIGNYSGNTKTGESEGGGITRFFNSPIAEVSLIAEVTPSYYENCEFIGNSAYANGGAFSFRTLGPKFTNCTFDGNSAGNNGGALDVTGGNPMKIESCIFKNNIANVDGGAINNAMEGSMYISSSTFDNNTAIGDGGAIRVANNIYLQVTNSFTNNIAGRDGGAILFNFGKNYFRAYIEGLTEFENNTANRHGGAFAYGGANVAGTQPGMTISADATFINNTATKSGGAIYNEANNITFENAKGIFTGNRARLGGAIFTANGRTFTLPADSEFTNNTASGAGAAVALAGPTAKLAFTGVKFDGNTVGDPIGTENGKFDTGKEILAADNSTATLNNVGLTNCVGGDNTPIVKENIVHFPGDGGDNGDGQHMVTSLTPSDPGSLNSILAKDNLASGDTITFKESLFADGNGDIVQKTIDIASASDTITLDLPVTIIAPTTATGEPALVFDGKTVYADETVNSEVTTVGNRIISIDILPPITALRLENIKFINGYASSGGGGAIQSTPAGDANRKYAVELGNCVFERNRANSGNGGAINVGTQSILRMNNCFFTKNYSVNNAGAVGSSNTAAEFYFTDCEFVENRANNHSGAVHSYPANAIYKNCKFIKNSAGDKGGAMFVDEPARIDGCEFTDNTSATNGGAISGDHRILINASSFVGNKSENTTPGDALDNGYVGGSAIHKSNNTERMIILNSTFYGNENAQGYAKNAGVIAVFQQSNNSDALVSIHNSTIANNITHDRSPVLMVARYNADAVTSGKKMNFRIYNSIITNGTKDSAPQLFGIRNMTASTEDNETNWTSVTEVDDPTKAVNIISSADGATVTDSFEDIFGDNELVDDKYIAPLKGKTNTGVMLGRDFNDPGVNDLITYYNYIYGTTYATNDGGVSNRRLDLTNWLLSNDQLGIKRFDFNTSNLQSSNPVDPLYLGAVMLPDDSYGPIMSKADDVYTAQFAVAEDVLADYTNVALMLTTHNGDGALTSAQVITDNIMRTAYGGFAVFTADVQKANPDDTVTAVVWDMDSNKPIANAVDAVTDEVAPALQHILSTSVRAEPEEPGEPEE